MSRRYGPPRFFVGILAWLLLPYAGWSAPQAHTTDANQSKTLLACNASPGRALPGQIVTLTAGEPGSSVGLVYSFSSSSGKLQHNGRTAQLDTAGVPVGTAISVTCQLVDGLGRRSSGEVTVYVLGTGGSHAAETSNAQVPIDAQKTAAELQLLASMSNAQAANAKNEKSKEALAEDAIRGVDSSPEAGIEHDTNNANAAYHRPPATPKQTVTHAHSTSPSHAVAAGVAVGALVGGLEGGAVGMAAPAPQVAKASDAYRQAEQVLQWKNELKNGKIDYLIPAQMKLHETTVVKVVVHGFADAAATSMAGATTGTLKVSPRMQVQLSAENNPDEFEIDPKAGQIQFVPIDGSATWMWNVTPKQPAENQTLTIRALLVYPDNGQQIEQEITSYTATVSVSVQGFWASLREAFWNDPATAIKYVLPGGAGFTALAGLIVWWWKRRHPAEDKPKKDE